jgi:hypothetical protein
MENASRDDLVVSIRPELDLAPASGNVEEFQNSVLRPILKFQNEFLMIAARQYVKKYHKTFNALKKANQESILIQASKHDPEFKAFVVWSVVGLMSSDELEFYNANRSELNKRISTMGVQRILSQLERLY